MSSGPQLRDWVLVLGGLSFSLAGLIIGIRTGEWRMPLYVVSFFGMCTAVFVDTLLRKLRDRQHRGETVTIPGGVEISMDMRRVWWIGGGVLYLGLLIVFVILSPPPLLWAIGVFLIAVSLWLLVGHWMRWLPRRTLRLDPEGIRFGFGKFTAFTDWDNVAAAEAAESFDNPVVLISLHSLDSVSVEPASANGDFFRRVASTRVFPGGDVSILAADFGVDAVPLAAAILRYASDPASRVELRRQGALVPPT